MKDCVTVNYDRDGNLDLSLLRINGEKASFLDLSTEDQNEILSKFGDWNKLCETLDSTSTHGLILEEGSIADRYFNIIITPCCKGTVARKHTEYYGVPAIEYIINHEDYVNCFDKIKVLRTIRE